MPQNERYVVIFNVFFLNITSHFFPRLILKKIKNEFYKITSTNLTENNDYV